MKQKREQIVISLKDSSDDSIIIRDWIDQFFVDADGKLKNNLSYHMKIAIMFTFINRDVPVDPRYMIHSLEDPAVSPEASVSEPVVNPAVSTL